MRKSKEFYVTIDISSFSCYSTHMLKYILLGFLNYGSMSGYDLKTMMDQSTMHFWHAYHSQIYTTLRKLEDEGAVQSETTDDDEGRLNRRVYTLTEAGRADLLAWLAQPLEELPQVKEELLLKLFFSAQRDKDSLLDELRYQRRMHAQKQAYYRQLDADHLAQAMGAPPQLSRDAQFWAMTLEFGKSYEDMYLHWLDGVIARIEALV
jgi:PadR family transcriptional regulator, regulatory protein AphA